MSTETATPRRHPVLAVLTFVGLFLVALVVIALHVRSYLVVFISACLGAVVLNLPWIVFGHPHETLSVIGGYGGALVGLLILLGHAMGALRKN